MRPASFSAAKANGLWTVNADDSMWPFSIFADWAATGHTSFLELLPPYVYQPGSVKDPRQYTNLNAAPVFLGELPVGVGSASLQNMTGSIPPQDLQNLEQLQGNISSQGAGRFLRSGSFTPSSAVDLDGDGLPDMSFIPTKANNAFQRFFTIRDRTGATHPFLAQPPIALCPSPAISPVGNATDLAYADADGDGITDEILFDQVDSRLGPNPNIFDNNSQTAPAYFGTIIYPGRGDGRFGVPGAPGNCWDGYGTGIIAGGPYSNWDDSVSHPPNYPVIQSDVIANTLPVDAQSQRLVRFADLNGDGMLDYALLDHNGLHVCIRYGGFWDTAHWQCVNDTSLGGNDQSNPLIGHPTIMIGDVDGTGINRVVYFPTRPVHMVFRRMRPHRPALTRWNHLGWCQG